MACLFCFQAAKERGRAGRSEGIHYYSFKQSFSLCGLKVTTFSNDCKLLIFSVHDAPSVSILHMSVNQCSLRNSMHIMDEKSL